MRSYLVWSTTAESLSMEGLLPVSLRRTGQAKSLRHPALHSHFDACWLGKHSSAGDRGESKRHNLRHLVLRDALFTHSYSAQQHGSPTGRACKEVTWALRPMDRYCATGASSSLVPLSHTNTSCLPSN